MPRASEKAVPEKLGRQTPTAAVVLPYTTYQIRLQRPPPQRQE
jgi:hypothetical protein